jgi:hypothetical protein
VSAVIIIGAVIIVELAFMIRMFWKGPFIKRIRVYPPQDAKFWVPDWGLTSVPEDVWALENRRRMNMWAHQNYEKLQAETQSLLNKYRDQQG